jgi:hypothetical protein
MANKANSVFIATIATAIVVSACGRQITPNPAGLGPGGAPPGYMALFFTVAAPFDFSDYQYMFVFNTSGSGITPSTDTVQTNWAGYMFALVASGNSFSSHAQAVEFIRSKTNPHAPPGWLPLLTTPQQLSYNLDSNGTATQFSMLAQRAIFAGISSSPSPSPSASPSNLWTFNAFTIQSGGSQGQWYFQDSLGPGGPSDPQFVSPSLCMTQAFDNTYYASYTPAPASAQIVSVEIANNPVSPKPCP